MQINDTVAAELRAWGARYLGSTAALSEAEARAALLQRVQDEGGVPDRRAVSAYQLVAGAALAAPRGAQADGLADLETQLRGELDDFARSFFMLDVVARRSRWQALKRRGDWLGPVQARLEHLRTALDLDPARIEHADPLVPRFADFLAELFVLRACPRALRRQEILGKIDDDLASWKQAARTLEAQWPRIAMLDELLLSLVAHPEAEAKSREARRTYGTFDLAAAYGTQRTFEVAPDRSQPRATANQGSGTNWLLLVILLVIGGALRLAYNAPPEPSPPPRVQPVNPKHVRPLEIKDPELQKFIEMWRKDTKQ